MHYLLFFAAACIELLGMTISVIGIGQLVGMNYIIILMAIAFDVGRIVTVSALQRHWATFNMIMRGYGLIAIAITMTITSFGAAGYLTKAIQGGVIGVEKIDAQLHYLQDEKTRLVERKKQIDDGISKIPDTYTPRQRQNLMAKFEQEQQSVTSRISELDKQIPELETSKLSNASESSAILSLAKSFSVSVESTIKFLVMMIIFVFEPFAIYLIMCGNHVLMKKEKVSKVVNSTVQIPTMPANVMVDWPVTENTVQVEEPPQNLTPMEDPVQPEAVELELVPIEPSHLTKQSESTTLDGVETPKSSIHAAAKNNK